MKYYSKENTRKLVEAVEGKLIDVANDYDTLTEKTGRNFITKCPLCGGHLSFNEKKQVFKCFSCQQGGVGAINYLMKMHNMDFPACLLYIHEHFNVIIVDEPVRKKKIGKHKTACKAKNVSEAKSFCAKMLQDSGLTFDDVSAKIFDSKENRTTTTARCFKPGTVNNQGKIDLNGDDAIITYYDLEGIPVKYEKKTSKGVYTGKYAEYFRVRWADPNAHLNKNKKPFKYKSPIGSGTPIYIPQKIRDAYRQQEPIETLFIQEGEKKAEKACKHKMMSIGISGIQNLAYHGVLPEDLVRIIDTCKVKNVVLLFDADWDDLSHNIGLEDDVQKRPLQFFFAARNYKDYMRSLANRKIYIETYVGHVKENENEDKGVDDLLANSLAGKENDLIKDVDLLMNTKELDGKFIQLFKITSLTDHNIKSIWDLDDSKKFALRHKDALELLPEFKIGKFKWKFENGEPVIAQRIMPDEEFWTSEIKTDRQGNERKEYNFKYLASHTFLQNRGFGRYRRPDGSFTFVHMQHPIIEEIEACDARDYLFSFAKEHCPRDVVEMLIKGVTQYVGPDKLSLLNYVEPKFVEPKREEQIFYFKDNCWTINATSVTTTDYVNIHHNIWSEQKRNVQPEYTGKMINFSFDPEKKECSYKLFKKAEQCDYLNFLINTSNFTWRKEKEIKEGKKIEISTEEIFENNQHLLSKLCAVGYMLLECKDANVARAVIGMDGKQSEVGESNGRSGKSLLGELMRQVVPIAYLNGKSRNMLDDQFVWNDVSEKTKVVFVDDVLISFDFEQLFPNITGDWSINYKGGRRMTLPFARSPKIYISTNHTIKGAGSSFTDRQWLLGFSDFYNDKHKPIDDFGCLFFAEWDYEQWNLLWNLLANCIQLYLKFGVVQAPNEGLEQRKLRQAISETFLAWADEYFSGDKLNRRIPRKEMNDKFFDYDPTQRKYIKPYEFKKRLKMYCELRDFKFNPHRFDSVTGEPSFFDKKGNPMIDDKTGGVEYILIGDKNFNNSLLEGNSNSKNENDEPDTDELGF